LPTPETCDCSANGGAHRMSNIPEAAYVLDAVFRQRPQGIAQS
jgi:hypothetical protein